MEAKMNVRMKRAEAGRAGARRRWGTDRKATRMVRVFEDDADTLGQLAATTADAVHFLLAATKIRVFRAPCYLDTRDAKTLCGLREPGNRLFVEGVQVAYPASERSVVIAFPKKKLGEILAAVHLDFDPECFFPRDLEAATWASEGEVAVASFQFENPGNG